MKRRVVVTGMGGVTPLGSDESEIFDRLQGLQSGISYMPEWEEFEGIRSRVAGKIHDFEVPDHYPRKKIRSMGRVALLSTRATELALEQAGLLDSDILQSGRVGVAYGSSSGSPQAVLPYAKLQIEKALKGISATSYIQMMSHTCPANVALFFEIPGRIVPTSSACTSASQAIGYSMEMIRHGYQDIMVAGGAEELCVSIAAVFDVLFATSSEREAPHTTPRPFDVERDGLVVSEGAATLILEELEHAKARGAKIYAELVGFGTNSDGNHITNPSTETMQGALRLSLQDARLDPEQIGYVSAHATATELGDIAESETTRAVLGERVAISSLKGYTGHTLGACGSIEAWLTIAMMNRGWFAPTLNLKNVDQRCADLDYITGTGRNLDCEYIMSNNFAFGGINTSLIFKKWHS